MLIKKNLFLLISSIGLIVFGLNEFFEFIPFKKNSLIIGILSLLNFVFIIKMLNKENNLK